MIIFVERNQGNLYAPKGLDLLFGKWQDKKEMGLLGNLGCEIWEINT